MEKPACFVRSLKKTPFLDYFILNSATACTISWSTGERATSSQFFNRRALLGPLSHARLGRQIALDGQA